MATINFGTLRASQVNSSLLKGLTDQQVRLLSSDIVDGLSNSYLMTKNADGHTVLSCLIDSQLQALTKSQVSNVLPKLTKEQFQKLSKTQVSNLGDKELKDVISLLSPDQVSALTWQQLSPHIQIVMRGKVPVPQYYNNRELLSLYQIGYLSKSVITSMPADQLTWGFVNALTVEQRRWLSNSQLKVASNLYADLSWNLFLKGLTASQVDYVFQNRLRGIDYNTKINFFTTEQLTGLSAATIKLLSRDGLLSVSHGRLLLQILSPSQLDYLTPGRLDEAVTSIDVKKFQKLGRDVIQRLGLQVIHDRVSELTTDQVAYLTLDQLHGSDRGKVYHTPNELTLNQIQQLPKEVIAGLFGVELLGGFAGGGEKKFVKALTATQIGWLTPEQLGVEVVLRLNDGTTWLQDLSKDVFSKLSSYVIQQLLVWGRLPDAQLKNLAAEQLFDSDRNGIQYNNANKLTDDMLKKLSPSTIRGLTVDQLMTKVSSGSKLVEVLTDDQVRSLRAEQLSNWSFYEQSVYRRPELSFVPLSDSQIQQLSKDVIEWMPAELMVTKASSGNKFFDVLSKEQVGWLSSWQAYKANYLSAEKVKWLGEKAIQGLSASELMKTFSNGSKLFDLLSDDQVKSLRADQLSFRDFNGQELWNVAQYLSDEKVKWLGEKAIQGLSAEQLMNTKTASKGRLVDALSDKQLGYLKLRQIVECKNPSSKLLVVTLAPLSDFQIQQLSGSTIQELGAELLMQTASSGNKLVDLLSSKQVYLLSAKQIWRNDKEGILVAGNKIKWLSRAALQGLTSEQLRGNCLDGTSLIDNLSDPQLGWLLPAQFTNAVISNMRDQATWFLRLNKRVVSGLQIKVVLAHFASFSLIQLGYLTASQLYDEPDPGQQNFSPILLMSQTQIQSLDPSAIRGLPIGCLNSPASNGLSVFDNLSSVQLLRLTASQILGVVLPQLKAGVDDKKAQGSLARLSGEQLSVCSDSELIQIWPLMNTDQISHLSLEKHRTDPSADLVSCFSNEQAALLGEVAIHNLSGDDLFRKTSDGSALLNALTNSQLGMIAPENLDYLLNKKLLKANRQSIIERAQFFGVKGLSYETITALAQGLTEDQIRSLSKDQIMPPGTHVYGCHLNITAEQFKFLSPETAIGSVFFGNTMALWTSDGQFCWGILTDAQLAGAPSSLFSLLTPEVLKDFSSDLVSKLTYAQLTYKMKFEDFVFPKKVITEIRLIDALDKSQIQAISAWKIHEILKNCKESVNLNLLISNLSADQLSYISPNNGRAVISYFTTDQITKVMSEGYAEQLASSVLNQFDASGQLIAADVGGANLTKDQQQALTASALAWAGAEGKAGATLIQSFSEDQLHDVSKMQYSQFSDALATSLTQKSEAYLKLSQDEQDSITNSIQKKIVTTNYGTPYYDAGLRMMHVSKNTRSYVGGAQRNFAATNLRLQVSLQNALTKVKSTQRNEKTEELENLLLGLVVLSTISNAFRWGLFGGVKDTKSEQANAANAWAGFMQNLTQCAISAIKATEAEDVTQEAALIASAVGSGTKALGNFARMAQELKPLEQFSAVYLAGDIISIGANCATLATMEGPTTTPETVAYSLVISQVCLDSIGFLEMAGTAIKAATLTGEAIEKFAPYAEAAFTFGKVLAGFALVAQAANPVPYYQAEFTSNQAKEYEQIAEGMKKLNVEDYAANKVAKYLNETSLSQYISAGFNTGLLGGTALYLMLGSGVAPLVVSTFAQLFLALGSDLQIKHARAGLYYDIEDDGGIDKTYAEQLSGQNKAAMNLLLENGYQELLKGMSQLTLLGGQTLSQHAVNLGLYAKAYDYGIGNHNGDTAFSQAKPHTSNFANVLNANTGEEYITKIDLFDKTISYSGEKMQYVDLSGYIKRGSTKASVISPCMSAIEFFRPLTPPDSEYEKENSEERGKNTSSIEYMNTSLKGAVFNLAAQGLDGSEYLSINLSNLLVNYSSTDSSGDGESLVFLNNTMTLGNAQYYIYGSLADFEFKDADSNSGSGKAVIDYSRLGDTGYDASIHMIAGSSIITVQKNLTFTNETVNVLGANIKIPKSFYYQFNNKATTTVSAGKETAEARYLAVEKKYEALNNQEDTISGDSCVQSVVAMTGSGNVMTGYNGWVLQGGQNATYVFNRHSNSFNRGSAEDPALIHIYEGVDISFTDAGDVETALSKMNYISVESLLSVLDVTFYLDRNLRDLHIVNTETSQAYIVYDFMDNAAFNTIYLSVGKTSYMVSGSTVATKLLNKIDELSEVVGTPLETSYSWLTKLSKGVGMDSTDVIVGTASGSHTYYGTYEGAEKFRCIDYSQLSGSIEVDLTNSEYGNYTVFKRSLGAGATVGADVVTDAPMIIGTAQSDNYLNISGDIQISDSSGHNLFSVAEGGHLELSGMEGISFKQVTAQIDIYLNDKDLLNLYVDPLNNLHIESMDANNAFSIVIDQYDSLGGVAYEGNLALNCMKAPGESWGYLDTAGINRLVDAMATINQMGVSVASWQTAKFDVSPYFASRPA